MRPDKAPLFDRRAFVLLDRGLADYNAVYTEQRDLVEKKRAGLASLDYLIFVEHPDFYTFGRKSKSPVELPNSRSIERGGEATFHNPGQLVAYPILELADGERDVHQHLRRIEDTLIGVLSDFQLQGERRTGATGVWLAGEQKKIASIGVAVSSWVTYHGLALNVENDLSGFSRISPCGFSAEVMTSLKSELGAQCPSMEEVKESLLRHFSVQFGRQLVI